MVKGERRGQPKQEHLWEFIKEAARATSIEEVCRSAVTCAVHALEVDTASVQLADEEGIQHVVASDGRSETFRALAEGSFRWKSSENAAEPILIADIDEAENLQAFPAALRLEEITGLGLIPLKFNGKLLGVLGLYYREKHCFTDEEVLIAQSIAGHLSAVVAQFQARREAAFRQYAEAHLRESQARMTRLQELTAALSQEPSPGQIYEILVQHGIQSVGARAGGLLVTARDGSTLEFVHAHGYHPDSVERFAKIHIEAFLPAADAYRERKPVLIETQADWYEQYPDISDVVAHNWGEAFACVPVSTTGVCHGVLVFSFEEACSFTEEDLAFFMNLGRQGALALERAHFYKEAERTLRSRENLLAMVAHDLRGPLTVVSMFASQMLQRSPGTFEREEFVRRAELLLHKAQQMERLVRDTLDFSAIDAGKLSVSPECHDLVTILRQAVEAARLRAGDRTIELIMPEADDGLEVLCDRGRVAQIMDNLIGNAIKFTGETGRITVRCTMESDEALIAVEDTGEGIAPEDLPHLFERFWSGERKDGNPGGHGLGLFIVKGLVEAQGGRIWAESTPGEGSTFFFTLPQAGTDGKGAPRTRHEVLLIDDDDAFRREVREILTEQGFDVAAVSNGREALEWLNENSLPSLVLMDLMMPVMDGWELYTQMQTDPVLATIPVVVISSADSSRVEPLRAHVADYLQKPVGLKQLIDVVTRYSAA